MMNITVIWNIMGDKLNLSKNVKEYNKSSYLVDKPYENCMSR